MSSFHGRNTEEHSTGVVLHGEQAGFCGSPQNLKTTDPWPQPHEVNRARCVAGVSTELLLTHGLRHRSNSSHMYKAHLCGSQPGWPCIVTSQTPGILDTVYTVGVLGWFRHPLLCLGRWKQTGDAACGSDQTMSSPSCFTQKVEMEN